MKELVLCLTSGAIQGAISPGDPFLVGIFEIHPAA